MLSTVPCAVQSALAGGTPRPSLRKPGALPVHLCPGSPSPGLNFMPMLLRVKPSLQPQRLPKLCSGKHANRRSYPKFSCVSVSVCLHVSFMAPTPPAPLQRGQGSHGPLVAPPCIALGSGSGRLSVFSSCVEGPSSKSHSPPSWCGVDSPLPSHLRAPWRVR